MLCPASKNHLETQLSLQDVTFHQCVNLGKFNTEKVVSFVPPDGEFELMKYRCQDNIVLPFRILPIINEIGRTRLEVHSLPAANLAAMTASLILQLYSAFAVSASCPYKIGSSNRQSLMLQMKFVMSPFIFSLVISESRSACIDRVGVSVQHAAK